MAFAMFCTSRSILTVAGFCLAGGVLAASGASGAAAREQAETVTFSRDIAPILFEHCVICHRPGAVAPMSLMSYQEVRPWARAIEEQVSARRMPPWKPEPGHGGPFIGDRSLSDEQVARIRQWVAEGAVEGSPADLPPMPERPAEWRLGEPDLVLEMPPYTLPAGGRDMLRKFAVPIPIAGARYVRAASCTTRTCGSIPLGAHASWTIVTRSQATKA
jgi:mono/diheme cytochrome c family protein